MKKAIPSGLSSNTGGSAQDAQASTQSAIDDMMSLDGMQSLTESRKLQDIFPNPINGSSVLDINLDSVNQMLGPVNEKLDTMLDSLCQ